jgi:hypothetical protein
MDQPYLFPLAALQTEGYAQPEPLDDDAEAVDEDANSTEDAA